MSRVTKLKKLYRRLYNAKKDRQSRYWAKSRRIRQAQGGKVYDWEPGYRRAPRGTWNVRNCRCGHIRHGKYGCEHGCEQGCAWGNCGQQNVPGIDFQPLMLNPLFDDGLLMREFDTIRSSRVAAICSAFALPSRQPVLVIGDSHITDLIAKELDKQP